MRIMLDTNILISMFVFKSMSQVIDAIVDKHSIVLCSIDGEAITKERYLYD